MLQKRFLKTVALWYAYGAFHRLLDLLDLRLKFSTMDVPWKVLIVCKLVLGSMVAVGLWREKLWGEVLFVFMAVGQLLLYMAYGHIFGEHTLSMTVSIVSLTIYLVLLERSSRMKEKAMGSVLSSREISSNSEFANSGK